MQCKKLSLKSRIVVSNNSNNAESLCWRKDFFTCSKLSLADIVKSQNSRGYSNANQNLVYKLHCSDARCKYTNQIKSKTIVSHSNNKVLKSLHKTRQSDQCGVKSGIVKSDDKIVHRNEKVYPVSSHIKAVVNTTREKNALCVANKFWPLRIKIQMYLMKW